MNGSMQGKRVVITGAARGIGAATAIAFAQLGAERLVLVDRDAAGLAAVRERLHEFPAEIDLCSSDVSDRAALDATVGAACRELERVDVLVNNAGIADENELEQSDIWHRVIDINLHGTYYTTLAVVPFLSKGGRIINIASILGRAGKARNTAYCTSKHAILGFTKALALDLAHRAITVNALLPSWVDTPLLRGEIERQAALIGADPQRMLANARKGIPLRRLVAAEEAAALITFLASDAAGAITAQGLVIDGGHACGL